MGLNDHKMLIELVKVGGVIGYENTLWSEAVAAPPNAPMKKHLRDQSTGICLGAEQATGCRLINELWI
ncbi:hypothetical protein QYF36_018569 [Acer negundo]|nr:hypothetical protein QYF36_018569 [Acer negundo]